MNASRLTALAIFATAAVALADDPPPPETPIQPVAPYPDPNYAPAPLPTPDEYKASYQESEVKPRWVPPTKFGMGLVVGGGVTDFIDDRAHNLVDVGPEWSARFALGTRSIIAGEAAYIGSTQEVRTLAAGNGQLLQNGIEGLLRINFTTRMFQPYIAGGLGWSHYNLTNATALATADVDDRADVLVFPAAAGLAWRARGFIVDGRFNIGVPLTTPVIPALSTGGAGTTWGVSGNVGFEF